MMSEFKHQSILVKEVLSGLAIKPDGIYLDLTFGRGGHSAHILQALGPTGRLMAVDKDPEAVSVASQAPFNDARFSIHHAAFDEVERIVQSQGWVGQVSGILLDLGVSSPQLDKASRGFSFMREGPLDMRMNPTTGIDAATWLQSATASDIADVLWRYGEERSARRIAAAIVEIRESQPLETTLQLAELIERVCPRQGSGKHPATKSFQAIRIFINKELEELERCLQQCLDILSVGGRMCVISFHSLEDRMVKRFIKQASQGETYPSDLPIKDADIVRHAKRVGSLIRPSKDEVQHNARARSARLRIMEKQ